MINSKKIVKLTGIKDQNKKKPNQKIISKSSDLITNSDANNKKQFFHTSSKLTRLQRKYCHCLMKVRPKIGKSIQKLIKKQEKN